MGAAGTGLLVLTSAASALAGCVTAPDAACAACHAAAPSTLFVSDRGISQVLRYDGDTGAFEDVFASAVDRIDRPAGVRLGPSGHVYVAGFGRGDIGRHDPRSGDRRDVFYADTTLLEEPLDLVFRGSELLVLGNDTGNLVGLDAAGRVTRELGYPDMRSAKDLTLAPDARTVYVGVDSSIGGAANPSGGTAIQRWDVDTGVLLGTFGTSAELASATSLALRDDGTLYVADWDRGQVLRYVAATGQLVDVVVEAASGTLQAPVALDLGPDGALYVLDDLGIHRLDPDTGSELGLIVATGDGHNVRPRAFTFVSETAIAQAIARVSP